MEIKTPEVENTTNFDGETFEGTLNSAKLASVMQILIRNYNSPELATLREWVSNAHDSHVEAGVKTPVKVTLPSRFSQNLIVEDFGVGMSYDQVRNVYASFLNSTKAGDNFGIGGFGIGGKSALAISDQYTMIAVKDGLKNVFVFERSSKGGLSVKAVVRDKPTDEGNGVKVTVVASNGWNFNEHQINDVLNGWRPEEVEIVGGKFTSVFSDAIEFKHGVIKSEIIDGKTNSGLRYGYRSGYSKIRVLVGPVSYPMPDKVHQALRSRDNYEFVKFIDATRGDFAIRMNIGDVTFPSSREVIEPTTENTEAVIKALKKFYAEVQGYIDAKVKNLKTIEEAYAFAHSPFIQSASLKVLFNGRDVTQIKYVGQKHYTAQQDGDSVRIMDQTLGDAHMTSVESSKIDLIVKVTAEEAALTPDTQRKYIRATVKDELDKWLKTTDANGSRIYHHRSFGILLTTEDDELYPVTSKVVTYSEIKKAPVASAGSRARVTDAEAIKRAANEGVIAYNVETKRVGHALLGDLVKADGPTVMFPEGGESTSLVQIFNELFELKGQVFAVQNKRALITIKRVHKHVLTPEEYIKTLTAEQKDAVKSRLKRLKRAVRIVNDLHTLELIDKLNKEDRLEANAKKLFPAELTTLAEPLWRSMVRYSYNTKQSQAAEALNQLFDFKKLRESRGDDGGLFSLLNYNGMSDKKEAAAYVNWSADRYIAANAGEQK